MKNSLKRNSNIELLRVLSMFLIVCSHYIYHGLKEQGFDRFDLNTIMGGGKLFDYGAIVYSVMCCSKLLCHDNRILHGHQNGFTVEWNHKDMVADILLFRIIS